MDQNFTAKFLQILREENEQADCLAKAASTKHMIIGSQVLSFTQHSLPIVSYLKGYFRHECFLLKDEGSSLHNSLGQALPFLHKTCQPHGDLLASWDLSGTQQMILMGGEHLRTDEWIRRIANDLNSVFFFFLGEDLTIVSLKNKNKNKNK